jgi:CheY-like chemotaxis protein
VFAAQALRAPGTEVHGMARVLVVDDDLDTRLLFAWMLRDEGYEVTVAADGYEAIEEARLRRPDVILLDYMMPRLDGVGFCDVCEREDALRDVPIVMVTAAPEAACDAGEPRVAEVLRKPVTPDRLVQVVQELCPVGVPRGRTDLAV